MLIQNNNAMVHNIFDNLRKPAAALAGRMTLEGMNSGHNPCPLRALPPIDFGNPRKLPDIGFDGIFLICFDINSNKLQT